jgi:DNA polymerase (family 10)
MEKKEDVIALSERICKRLKPLCKKIEIAGSIRRHEKHPYDIDIVLIPKDKEKLEEFMRTKVKAKFLQGGEHESTWKINGTKVELYYTNEEEWGAELFAYSARKGYGIGLRIKARLKGFKLTQHGLFDRKTGKKIAGRTETEIYHALGKHYKRPENRV